MLRKQKHCVKQTSGAIQFFLRRINSNPFQSYRLSIEPRLDVKLGYWGTSVPSGFIRKTIFSHFLRNWHQMKADVETI